MPLYRDIVARFCGIVALAFAGFAAQADTAKSPRPHIYATDWGLTLKSDGTGFYNELAHFVLAGEAKGADYEILPYRRAVRRFVADPEACIYPANLSFMAKSGMIDKTDGYVEGRAILKARMHIFSRLGEAPVQSAPDLMGKTLAYPLGASTPTLLKGHGAIFVPVADEVDKARLLLHDRVDLIVAALPDALFVFKHLGSPLPPYSQAFSFNAADLSVACHRTRANETFLKALSARIEGLGASGQLEAFLKEQGLEPSSYLPERHTHAE